MKITILDKVFKILDTKAKITIADSFVVRQNKIGTGNGEAKLYIGNENGSNRDFYGGIGFGLPCFLLKKDLLKYLQETKAEYLNPEQPYVNKDILPDLLMNRLRIINNLPDKIEFEIAEQTQIKGPRIYVNSNDSYYKLIRELSLPNITFISIVKLIDDSGVISYYFRLFADYFGDINHPYTIKQEEAEINDIPDTPENENIKKARIGQGKYRKELLELCRFCPITLISDDRLLIASHIKPWVKSTEFEKTDPLNGFMLTPTYDKLFDRGFMSFTNDKKTILSPFLSKMTYSQIGISDNKTFSHLPTEGRENYLEYHRNEILKK
jgi:putative restriction endonuclease